MTASILEKTQGLPPTARLVAVAIAEFIAEGVNNPSMNQLAKRVGAALKTVKNAITTIRKAALFRIISGRKTGAANRYELPEKGVPLQGQGVPIQGQKGVPTQGRENASPYVGNLFDTVEGSSEPPTVSPGEPGSADATAKEGPSPGRMMWDLGQHVLGRRRGANGKPPSPRAINGFIGKCLKELAAMGEAARQGEMLKIFALAEGKIGRGELPPDQINAWISGAVRNAKTRRAPGGATPDENGIVWAFGG